MTIVAECSRRWRKQNYVGANTKMCLYVEKYVCKRRQPAPQCGCIFRTMKSHVLSKHTSVRPFVCDTCGKAYAFEWALKLHLKNHTGSFDYSCEHCDYKTNCKQYYESKLIFKQTSYESFAVRVFSCTVNIVMELS